MSKKRLNTLIGELFVEQMEINLFSTILDTPDFLWGEACVFCVWFVSVMWYDVVRCDVM